VDIYSPNSLQEYFDSYSPYFKSTAVSNIAAAMKIVLSKKTMDNEFVKVINYQGTIYLAVGAENIEMLKSLSKAFGKTIIINTDGTVQSDITI
jgi:hypothetical protein